MSAEEGGKRRIERGLLRPFSSVPSRAATIQEAATLNHVCRVCGVGLSIENTHKSRVKVKDWICRKCYNKYHREYYRKYNKTYPRQWKTGHTPVTDCLDKNQPISFKQLLERSGAGRAYARGILRSFVKLGLIKHSVEDDTYSIIPDNPLRFAIDGYYREAA